MTIEQILQDEILASITLVDKAEGVNERDLIKRIEIIKWVLENMKNPEIDICELMESKMTEVILGITQTHDIFEADKLHSELGILDWFFYQLCKDQQKKLVVSYN